LLQTNIIISNNVIQGGDIQVVGPDTSFANIIKNVNISNNFVIDPPTWGIRLKNVSGPSMILNNQVRNSNENLVTTGNTAYAHISLTASNNVEVYGNILTAIDHTTGANSKMLYYEGMSGARFYNNKFVNNTGALTIKAGTGNLNVTAWDNEGAQNIASGVSTFSGNGTTKAFVVNHGLDWVPDWCQAFAGSTDAKGDSWVDSFTATTFTVNFVTAPPAGTNNVLLYWTVGFVSAW
jgi:hypothetical protein